MVNIHYFNYNFCTFEKIMFRIFRPSNLKYHKYIFSTFQEYKKLSNRKQTRTHNLSCTVGLNAFGIDGHFYDFTLKTVKNFRVKKLGNLGIKIVGLAVFYFSFPLQKSCRTIF